MRIRRIAFWLLTFVLLATSASATDPKVLYLKVNDLQPYYYATLEDSYENPIDLTGATVVFTMSTRPDGAGTIKINRQVPIVTDAVNGKVEYRWQAGDTDTAGRYYVEFEVMPASGGKFTLPTADRAMVVIRDSLDTQ
jgi:hypothetical protein